VPRELRPYTHSRGPSLRAISALTPFRAKLKDARRPCSAAAVNNRSALTPIARGSLYVPTTRYSANPNGLLFDPDTLSLGRKPRRVYKSADRFLPPRLRRPTSKNPRGANSSRCCACPPAPSTSTFV